MMRAGTATPDRLSAESSAGRRIAGLASLLVSSLATGVTTAQTLTLPAYTGYARPDPNDVQRADDGSVPRCSESLVFYVDLAATGELHLHLERTDAAPASALRVELLPLAGAAGGPAAATPSVTVTAPASPRADAIDLGTFAVDRPGYHRLTLTATDGAPLRALRAVRLAGPAAAQARAATVERRNAASVHLAYEVPRQVGDDVEWCYCEVTPRTDPLWTYDMAIGWHRGYFGIQVNSATERRVIFSVWDAGDEAVDRRKVADADRVRLLAKGNDVVAESFGHEGTGGHSHLVHGWKLGDTFRFLVHAERQGATTVYTGWFWFADQQRWGLIASFAAPKDGRGLRGLYSFVENFHGANGDLVRDCEFGNLWLRTTAGVWLPARAARFTCDGHGQTVRRDRSGGVRGARFYLRSGGFEPATTTPGTRFEIEPGARAPLADAELPTIELPTAGARR